jgi:hypothetical protein
MDVTPAGTGAMPIQPLFALTALFVIVNVPPPEHATVVVLVAVSVAVGVLVAVRVTVLVAVLVAVGVLVAVSVAVGVLVAVRVTVLVAVSVAVGVLVTIAMVRPFIGRPTAGYPVAVDVIYAVAPVTPLNASLAIIVGLFPKKYTLLREVALVNAPSPMDVTPAGMVMAVRALALLNAFVPMDVSWLPAAKVMPVRALAR